MRRVLVFVGFMLAGMGGTINGTPLTCSVFLVGVLTIGFAFLFKRSTSMKFRKIGLGLGLVISIGCALTGMITGNDWFWLGSLGGFSLFAVSAVG